MKLVLIGIPGCGKSTQGNLLSEQLKIPYLSTGHIFRQFAKEKTPLGRLVKEILRSGLLMPDDKTIPIVEEYLKRPEYEKGYILDGFPRTIIQARKFKNNLDKVIYLEIEDKEALWRLAYRNSNLRTDDTVEAIKKRIEIFHKVTLPVINYYKRLDKLISVDGSKSIKEINRQILKSLGKQFVENKIKSWKKGGRTIIAVVGLPGSGKSQAVSILKKKGIPVVSLGSPINEYIDKMRLEHKEPVHDKVRQEFRDKYGMEAMVYLNKDSIKNALDGSFTLIIDGVRSFEEYLFLKKEFPKVKIYILALFANKVLRYKRISRRTSRNKLYGEERDINELIGLNMAPTIASADFAVDNNGSLEKLELQLVNIYRKIYYG